MMERKAYVQVECTEDQFDEIMEITSMDEEDVEASEMMEDGTVIYTCHIKYQGDWDYVQSELINYARSIKVIA